MRIAVVTTSYPTHEGDPAGHFVETEVAELERSGHEVCVLRPQPGGAFGWPGAPTRIRERPSRAFEAASWAARAALRLRSFAPDRVVAHWAIPSAFPIAMGGPSSAELEVVSHGGDVRLLLALPPRVRSRMVRGLIRRAMCWRFVSEELLASLEASLPPNEARALRACAIVSPGALEVPDVRDESIAKRDAISGRRLYVCAGRLVASKRVDKVIDYVATSHDHGTRRDERVLV
ncbi:MAG: hypothetical protein K0S65_6276, partial [Labilithrix sp.]|nr:hypothetical protein [Labilithrix sp.]